MPNKKKKTFSYSDKPYKKRKFVIIQKTIMILSIVKIVLPMKNIGMDSAIITESSAASGPKSSLDRMNKNIIVRRDMDWEQSSITYHLSPKISVKNLITKAIIGGCSK